MPVNSLQQDVAHLLMSLGSHGSKVWFAISSVTISLLVVLAVAHFLPPPWRARVEGGKLARVVMSDGFFLVSLVFTIGLLRLPGLSQLQLNPDEGGLILGARTLLHDPRFWLSFENTTLGPISTFSVAAVGALGFSIDYTSIKVLAILTWCAVTVFLFLGFRTLYSAALARLFVLPVAVIAATFTFWDYAAFNGEHMAVLLFAIAFWVHSRLLRETHTTLPGRSLALGIVLALIPFCKIQPGPPAFAWGVAACALAWWQRPARMVYHAAGALVPVTVLVVYLSVAGLWRDFWESYILNNVLYASDGWNATQQNTTFLQNALVFPGYLLMPRDSRGLFVFAGIVTAVASLLAVGFRSFRGTFRRSDVLLGLVMVSAAAVCVIMPKNNWTHYLLLLFVPTAMLLAGLLAAFFSELERREVSIRVESTTPAGAFTFAGATLLAVMVAVLGAWAPAVYAMLPGSVAVHEAATNLSRGGTPRPVVEGLLRYAAPGEPVGHWGVRFEELTEAGFSLGTRDAHIERALYPSKQQDYYLQRWVDDIRARRPRVVVDSCDGEHFERFRLKNFPREQATVRELYRFAEDVAGFHVYVLKDESGPTVDRTASK